MAVLKNNFETGIASGTAITIANSDDGTPSAGDASSYVDQGLNGASIVFDTTRFAHGTRSIKITQGTPETSSTPTLSWDFSPAVVTHYGRFYFWASAAPAVPVHIVQFWTGAAFGGFLDLNTDLTLACVDSTFTYKGASGFTITLSAWNRIEWRYFADVATGTMSVKLFSYDSTTQTGSTLDSTTGNFGAQISGVAHYINAVSPGFQYWIDDTERNTTGYPGPSYTAIVLADAPDAYWRLDEPSGTTVADSSGNGHTATYGTAVTLNQTSLLASDANKAAVFSNVVNSAITLNTPAYFNPSGTAAFSLECWFKATTLDTNGRRFFEKYADDGISLSIKSSVIDFERDSHFTGGTDQHLTIISPATGGTHHLVATYDGSNMRLYLDSVLAAGPLAATHAMASLNTYGGSLCIGDDGSINGTKTFIGTLDEVAIYTIALTAGQVLAHYNAGAAAAVGATTARNRMLLGVG